MKALILNSGIGSRMGEETKTHPKCMTKITKEDTIVSRQLKLLSELGIKDVVMTTGLFEELLIDYCKSLKLPIKYTFIKNPIYNETNYIYSIYCARNELDDDIILMHGDLVYTKNVLEKTINNITSSMTVSSTMPIPEKDFKAVILDGKIQKVGIEFFDSVMAAQPLYHLKKEDWKIWLDNIVDFCERNERKCYAENAFNEVSNKCLIYPLDVKDELCAEIDNLEDLAVVKERLEKLGE